MDLSKLHYDLSRAIEALSSARDILTPFLDNTPKPPATRAGHLTEDGKERLRRAMKKRWAVKRAAQKKNK